ncbi:MAG: isocitrate/isopropylmalate dehydrogenase family protein [Candidatus Nephthysia bennettiae]|uniref:Isocitrate/isopropylmalate dehydrogenase family protein n=1 Tax=Candidatus Nephthysia bennettiae TaxID=3127016 RepID=A0A934K1R8_9BACT|nr:isocitrate/isopropylmalate dehydrogenase family protein [Candidatus Dormibacteraeota bacterium]MBJ7613351.1 isocitrate/isopropylmalate dehydrogenase family protein [Candidatus Dormibacteraeota bacterium]PZR86443.1 MAG: isocitrate/isopropylmalate dehydrogenase family protein [Candidatus Dormibacteraeota bacterium]
MSTRIAVVPGDLAGQEVVPEAVRVLRAAGLDYEFEEFEVGAAPVLRGEPAMSDQTFEEVSRADAILFGAIGDPRLADVGYPAQVLLRLRFELDLYVNLRPARLYDDRLSPLRDPARRGIDLVIVRENTEGLYVGMGGRFRRGTEHEVAVQEDVNTHHGVGRILAEGFRLARGRLCMVDKSNAMNHAGGLWQERWAEARAARPDLETRHLYVDAAAMELVRDPTQFEVIVTGNLFGDILSDLTAALIGGMGLAPSANVNPETGRGLFEPVHGSAPNLAGKRLVNPLGAILTAGMMVKHLGDGDAAKRIESAVIGAIRAGECTRDVGGSLSTREAADAVIRRLKD